MNAQLESLKHIINDHKANNIEFVEKPHFINYNGRFGTIQELSLSPKKGKNSKIEESIVRTLLPEYNNLLISIEKQRIDTLIEQEQTEVEAIVAEAESKKSAAEQEKKALAEQLEQLRLSLNSVKTQAEQTTDEITAIEQANQAAIAEAIAQAEQAKADALAEQEKAFEEAKAAIEQAKADALAEQAKAFEDAQIEAKRLRTLLPKRLAFVAGVTKIVALTILLFGLNYMNATYFVGNVLQTVYITAFASLFSIIFLYSALVGDEKAYRVVRWLIPVELLLIIFVKPFIGAEMPELFNGEPINWAAIAGIVVFSIAYLIQIFHALESGYGFFNFKIRTSDEKNKFREDVLESFSKK